jgi:hypothetical protein
LKKKCRRGQFLTASGEIINFSLVFSGHQHNPGRNWRRMSS